MPTKIVDFSARSEVIRAEPFNAHFWQCAPAEFQAYLGRPREFLRRLGIAVPQECRIETTIENHDWLGDEAPDFESENDIVICNIGSGGARRQLYRVLSYVQDKAVASEAGKPLLHKPNRQKVKEKPHAKEKKGGKAR